MIRGLDHNSDEDLKHLECVALIRNLADTFTSLSFNDNPLKSYVCWPYLWWKILYATCTLGFRFIFLFTNGSKNRMNQRTF